jgi:hypothetical protein
MRGSANIECLMKVRVVRSNGVVEFVDLGELGVFFL